MSLITHLRRGEGPVWGRLKRVARTALELHVPAGGPCRPVFAALYAIHVAAREGVLWVLRFVWFEPLFRSQCEEVGPGLRIECLPYMTGRGRIVLGAGVRLSGKSTFAFGNRFCDEPTITLGEGTFVGHDCSLRASASVTLGTHCLLAGGVTITDFDGHPLDALCRRAGEPTPSEGIRPVVIGDDVWIGKGAIVLKGVTIGPRSVVGAGAVVVRDVPQDCVVAGNPARVVKRLADRGAI